MYIVASYMLASTASYYLTRIQKLKNHVIVSAIVIFAPITFLLLMGWLLYCIVYNWITD